LAFGRISEEAFKHIGGFGEHRMRTAFIELGLMAGSECIVPSPKTDYMYDKISPKILMSGFSEIAMLWGRMPICQPAPPIANVCWWRPTQAVPRPETLLMPPGKSASELSLPKDLIGDVIGLNLKLSANANANASKEFELMS
jgi:hypothetical protein